jgi:L-threonylcarbamoyladenylate synthase
MSDDRPGERPDETSGEEAIAAAVQWLAADGFVAYPTETVWGLGACANRPRAIERLMAWKGRGGDAPMSVLVDSVEAAAQIGCRFGPPARRLAAAFWPGPLTLVVPCDRGLAQGVARADGALGLRCSPHPVANALAHAVRAAGLGPLTSTSFNRSGEDPAADRVAAAALVRGRGPAEPLLVETGTDAGGAAPSSVVDCTAAPPRILRVGAIEAGALERTWTQGASPGRRLHPARHRPEENPSR